MGNCAERAAASGAPGQVEEEAKEKEEEKEDMNTAPRGGGEREKRGGGGSCRVKLLLTRKELEWLILHLKEKGEQKLEDLMMDMSREIGKQERAKHSSRGGCWKPTLHSILETPPPSQAQYSSSTD